MAVWLRDAAGVRLAPFHGSLLIGRAPACHVVVDDARVSRKHALLLEDEDGAQVVPLGRGGVVLDGSHVDRPTRVRDGGRLRIVDTEFQLEVRAEPAAPSWALEIAGVQYPLRGAGLRLGGGSNDDLHVPRWPAASVVLYVVTGAVVAEVDPSITVLGGEGGDDGVVTLTRGSRLSFAELTATLVLLGDEKATLDLDPSPTEAHLELMPNGGLLKLRLDRLHCVWLPQKRGDLLAALLSQSGSHAAGDWVPDDVLIPRVWGAEPITRAQVNTLIHRTRLTLSAAGLHGSKLIERAPGGGSTRIRLARGAATSVG
jgi:hypothetical protein